MSTMRCLADQRHIPRDPASLRAMLYSGVDARATRYEQAATSIPP